MHEHTLNRHKGGLKTPEGAVAGTNRCGGAVRCILSSFSFVLFYFLCSFFFFLLTTSFQAANHPVTAQKCVRACPMMKKMMDDDEQAGMHTRLGHGGTHFDNDNDRRTGTHDDDDDDWWTGTHGDGDGWTGMHNDDDDGWTGTHDDD